jgi:hypothetical protein
MRGLTPSFSSFDGPDFDERRFERRLDDGPAMAPAIGWYGSASCKVDFSLATTGALSRQPRE